MRFLADLHVHSRFSLATSRELRLSALLAGAQRKGIALVATGDFTHPDWRREMESELEPAEEGLFRLRPPLAREADRAVPTSCRSAVRFILSAEISTVYRHADRTRKVHHLVYARDFRTAQALSKALATAGRLDGDGRPTLKLDSAALLRIVVQEGGGAAPSAFLIPAHVWTPHFSVLGTFSGFESIEECYGELAQHIFAVETGLSSDPAMNWRLSSLDRFTLVSNSDAHSPDRLGREACRFDTALSFDAVVRALQRKDAGFKGTIEFHPQEGKYYSDGHRACGVRMTPEESRRADGRCPACGRKLTLGVCHRVAELADRPEGYRPRGAEDYESLIGLRELIAEALRARPSTRRVTRCYDAALERFGPELRILRETPLDALASADPPRLAEAVRRMRAGDVRSAPGYDGLYGVVRVFDDAPDGADDSPSVSS